MLLWEMGIHMKVDGPLLGYVLFVSPVEWGMEGKKKLYDYWISCDIAVPDYQKSRDGVQTDATCLL